MVCEGNSNVIWKRLATQFGLMFLATWTVIGSTYTVVHLVLPSACVLSFLYIILSLPPISRMTTQSGILVFPGQEGRTH